MSTKVKRIIKLSVLPGEKTDGTGRMCIHLWVSDPNGKFTEPHALSPVLGEEGKPTGELTAGPTKGRLACDANRNPAPITKGNTTIVTIRSDDTRATTCLKCIASVDYKRLSELGE